MEASAVTRQSLPKREAETHRKIRFAKPDPAAFVREVKAETARYFEETGLDQKADFGMVLKTIILFTMTFGSYALILSNQLTALQMLPVAIIMGIGMAGVGFSVAHDALHGAYSHDPRVNRLLGFSFDLLGANGYMWKITHNVIHHTYTNIHGIDEDLTVSPVLRLSPGAPRFWYHRFQHLYGFAAYSLATLNWIFMKDYQQFLKKDLGPYRNKKHPRSEVITLIVMKLICYIYMLVIPLLVLNIAWWQVLLGFVIVHLTAGLILGVIFQLAHVVEGTDYPVPDETGLIEHEWVIHEMETTADFAQQNKLLSWYIGGLNYQIEHHLFPQVCSIHYPAISNIVRAAAARHNVPYHCQPTLRAAIRSHYRMLKQLGTSEVRLDMHAAAAH